MAPYGLRALICATEQGVLKVDKNKKAALIAAWASLTPRLAELAGEVEKKQQKVRQKDKRRACPHELERFAILVIIPDSNST